MIKQERKIYFDNAATTPLHPEVLDEMMPYLKECYGNASSKYSLGNLSRIAVNEARKRVANSLGADEREIYFTSSGSESDNWAIKGAAYVSEKKGKHIITSAIEHPAVLNTCKYMETKGYEATILPVDKYGFISCDDLERAIRPDTVLVTLMYANNEIGTIQSIKELAAVAKNNNVPFHTDAVQAMGSIPINVNDIGVDFLSVSAHKIYGPKGVGALYIRRGTKAENLIHGGHQEKGKRAATENVPGIVGFGKAAEIAAAELDKNSKIMKSLRDRAIDRILSEIPDTMLNGSREIRLPGNANISIRYIEGESILLMLDHMGICASSGSACTSGSLDPSHVLLAIGLPHEIAHGSLRLSFGPKNTPEEIDILLDRLKIVVGRLREMSPLYNERKEV